MRGWSGPQFRAGVRARARSTPGEMNNTERAYADGVIGPLWMAREIAWWAFQPWKLQIGAACYYEPDFVVVNADAAIECVEVKKVYQPSKAQRAKGQGEYVGWEDDARVKIKAAASRYPFFRFTAAALGPRGWQFEEIQSDGAQPVEVETG